MPDTIAQSNARTPAANPQLNPSSGATASTQERSAPRGPRVQSIDPQAPVFSPASVPADPASSPSASQAPGTSAPGAKVAGSKRIVAIPSSVPIPT